MHGLLLAGVTPDNTPHGYNLTFLLPEIGFIIVAAALFLRFRRRPQQVPGHGTPAIPLVTGLPKAAVPGGGPATAHPAPAADGAAAPSTSGGPGAGSPVVDGHPAPGGPPEAAGQAEAADQAPERPPPDDAETGG